MSRELMRLTVEDTGDGFWEFSASFDPAMFPAERQRLADLARRVMGRAGLDSRFCGVEAPISE
jgi:hypothetical protein